MNAEPGHTAIDLAREPAFTIGPLQVRPAALEVEVGGRCEALEARVMQVLVALGQRRRDETVSRDELIDLCWGGRIVSDDAIQRCISRLRKLGAASGAFEVEAVRRVGYRIRPASGVAPGRARARRIGPWLIVLAVLSLVAASVATWFGLREPPRPPRPPDRQVAVQSFEALAPGQEAAAFAKGLTDSVSGVLAENLPGVAVTGRERGLRGDLSVGGTVGRDGDAWRVRVHLRDVASGVTLWSSDFTGAGAADSKLRDEVAVATGRVIYDALEPLGQKGLRLDPRSVALNIKAHEGMQNRVGGVSRSETLRTFEQLVAREPNFVGARASLALALRGDAVAGPPEQRSATLARARREAETAIRMDPSVAGAAYDTLAMMALSGPSRDRVKGEDIFLKGIAKSNFHFLLMRECSLLLEVGRASEALSYCERALAIRPLASQIGAAYTRALYATGDVEGAQRSIAKFGRFHPQHVPTRQIRFDMAALTGSPDEALGILADPARRPPIAPEGVAALRQFLEARISRSPAQAAQAVAALRQAYQRGQLDPVYPIYGAAVLGRPDDAFALLEANPPYYVFHFLFSPAGETLRADPRFWGVAAKNGLVQYWRARGRWPDFCAAPGATIDCPRAADRALEARAS